MLELLSSLSAIPILPLILISTVFYLVGISVYRLYLHPLSKFPGPKLAALTLWYEIYYDVYLDGQYQFHIKELHKTYGPIIRINPFELHINDPSFYEEVYASAPRKRDRSEWVMRATGFSDAFFATVPHELHKVRRAAVAPFFSKANVRKLQPVLDKVIDGMFGQLRLFLGSRQVVRLDHMTSAYANVVDIVMEYSFARSENRITKPDFDPGYHEAIAAGSYANFPIKHFYWFFKPLLSLPEFILDNILTNKRQIVKGQAIAAMTDANTMSTKSSTAHPTIFHDILSSKLPASEKSVTRLTHEAHTIIAGGTFSTAWPMTLAIYHMLKQPLLLRRLKDELAAAIPDASTTHHADLHTFEALPFLTAVVKESLRLGYGTTHRLARIATEEDITYTDASSPELSKKYTIPRGTPMGMSTLLLHHIESSFPNSYAFNPERWLGADAARSEKYLVSFSRGTRMCPGINLAYAEMYLIVGRLFRSFGSEQVYDASDVGRLRLFQTTDYDVETAHDRMFAMQHLDSKGIRAEVLPN
ncbi:cytochrome P450 [Mollisia scopiformis]|uniref:Cytochrome P450 n=1 Tax=Mollisia scopiformis TaxID=149040 RepID=A0A194XT49_MOLSC|nr:cytochrome P450 [Mollisia scopiformis]KUJ23224.1 cytochrome P450 [Mollisia scopiformis]